MTENVGKIRIGCEVDSSGAKRGIDDLYKAINSLSKSINSLLSSKSISIGLKLANGAESTLLNEVTKVTDNISKTAKITVDMEVNGEGLEKFDKGASSVANTLSESINSTADVKTYADVLYTLSDLINNISYNDKASKFFKSLSGDITNFYTKTAPFMQSMDTYTRVLNNLAICVDNLSNAGNADQFFKNIKKYNDVLSKVGYISNSIGTFGQSLNTLSNGVSSLSNAGDVSDNLGSIKSTIGLLSKVNDIQVDATKADSISNSLRSLGEGVSSLSTVGDISENLVYIKSTLSVINKLNETNVDSSQIAGIGTSITTLVNTISNIHVPKKADNILSLIESVKGLLTVAKSIGGADSNIDASKINSIGASITSLVSTITNINVSGSSANITELVSSVKGIASIFTAIGKLDPGSIDSAKIEAIATSISSLVSRLSSINIPENATQIVELANAIRTLNSASAGTSSNSKTTSLLDRLNSGAGKALGVVGKLIGVFKNLHNKIKGVHTAADKMGNAIKKSYTELYSKIKLITGAIKTFINAFKNLDSAYSKQISAETRLSVAMSNSTGATRGQIQEIKDLTAEYQQLGILGDEVQLTGLQELSTYVESTESIKKLLPVMNDMTAQQFGFEATTENAFTIATALGKVLNGNTDTLKRYGYAFNDAQKQILKYGTEEQKVAVLTDVITSAVGGMNNAMANTPTGRITQLKNNFGDLKEAIGELLNYVVLPFVKSINTVILRITQGVKSLTAFIKEALGIKTVTKEVKTLLDTSSNKTANSLDGVSDSLDDTASSADSTKKKVKNLLGSFDELNILSESTSSNLDDSSDALDNLSLGQGVTDTIEVPDLGDFKKRLSALFDSLDFEKLGLNFAEKINEYIDKWNPAASGAALADKLNKLIKFANAGLKNINFKQLGQKIGTWINSFVGKFDSKQLGNTIATLINQAVAFANGLLTETDFKKLGESIGTFISELFTDIDYEAMADLIINAVEAAVDTAAGIVSKIDFKAIGKGLAKGVNKLSKSKSTWVKAARTIGDAIIGVLDLAISFIDNFDAEAFGESLGAFIANLQWEKILPKAGEAIVKALWTVIKINIGAYKENPFAGVMATLITGIAGLKISTDIIKGVKNFGKALGLVSSSAKQAADTKAPSTISKLASSISGLISAHPAVAIIAGIGTALAGVAIGIANLYADYVKRESEWKQYLLNVTALDEASKSFIESTKTSNEKIKDISKAIKDSANTADADAAKFETLYNNLSTCVDEYGNIKEGSEEYANYLIGELNNAYGTNLENINGQIQGYTDLCNSIDKYIAKMKAQAIVTANEGNYADAITEYKKANKDLVEAQQGYEDNLNDLNTLADNVKQAYIMIFSEDIDFGNINTQGGLDKLEKAVKEIGYALSDDPLGNAMLGGKAKRVTDESLKVVKSYFNNVKDIAKKYNKTLDTGSNFGKDVVELANALHNNSYEFLNAKNTAQDTIDTTKQQIDGYELLTKTLNSTTASVQDINAAMSVYVNDIPVSKGTSSLNTIIDKYKEWETEYNKAVELVKKGELEESVLSEWESTGQALQRQMALAKANIAEGVATWTVDATKALFNSDNFASEGEYLKWYAKLFGEEHIPDAIASLTKVTGMSPDDIIKQYLKTYPEGTSESNVKQIVSKLYPEATKEEIASKVKTYMNYGRAQALKRYFDEHPNMSESDKKAFLKSIMPDGTSDDTVNKLYKVITDTVDSAVFKAEKHFDGGMFSTEGALGDVLSPTAKNAMKNVKSGNKFVNIGNSMAAGVEEGLKSGIPNIQKASSNLVDESDKSMRKEGEIHSPSKLTKLVGIALSEGVAVGIKEGLNKILNAIKYVCDKTVDAYKITGMNANILKTYAYSYVSNFFNGIALKGTDLNKVYNITDKVVSAFKITLWNSGILTKYGNTYVNDYIKGVVLSDANKKKVTGIQTVVITLLKPSTNTLNSAKTYGSSILQNMISGMTVSDNNKTSISNAGVTIYNSMITSMNGLTGKLSTSSANFISYLTNPITNGLKLLLDSMDLFYTKFRNKWQGVANLFSNKFIAGSMGVTKVPNLNDNYYPFGDNIVKLAQGAVIKPNNEFMAILGDQKRGLNIETPLATMKQAFIEALNDGGYSGGNITIPVYIGNEKIDTLIVNSNNRRGMRNNGRV